MNDSGSETQDEDDLDETSGDSKSPVQVEQKQNSLFTPFQTEKPYSGFNPIANNVSN